MTAEQNGAPAFAVRGPIYRADLPGLSLRVCRLLRAYHAPALLCDVAGVEADAVTVEALARLQLAAHHNGSRITLRNASAGLLALVEFMGLTDVLTQRPEQGRASRVQAGWETEEREQR